MNYDTLLPPRIRGELLHTLKPKRFKLWHKIVLCLVLLVGLRHLNTVPHREWSVTDWKYADGPGLEMGWYEENGKTVAHHKVYYTTKVYTAEGLSGSSYRTKRDDEDLGISSKKFGDVFLRTFGANEYNFRILRAIDP